MTDTTGGVAGADNGKAGEAQAGTVGAGGAGPGAGGAGAAGGPGGDAGAGGAGAAGGAGGAGTGAGAGGAAGGGGGGAGASPVGQNDDGQKIPVSSAGAFWIGLYFVAVAAVAITVLINIWPGIDTVCTPTANDPCGLFDNNDVRYILIVIAMGALGSFVHGATSLADYVGNQRLYRSWVIWLLLRPAIGAALAVVFYFILRGGLVLQPAGNGQTVSPINPYGIAAIAGLVGMFSKQATDKLREIFDNLFRTAKGDQRSDKLENPKPVLEDVAPPQIKVGTSGAKITVTGRDFVEKSVVQVGGSERKTKFVDQSRLEADLKDEDTAAAKVLSVRVLSPEPGGGSSDAKDLTIVP